MTTLQNASCGMLLLVLSSVVLGEDARFTSPDGRTRGYIDDRGRIAAPDGRTLGYVEPGGRIARPDGSTAGYLEDSEDRVGRLRSDQPGDALGNGSARR